MNAAFQDDVSITVLRRMKEGGFDFARVHPIDFFAIFPDEGQARMAATRFTGESINAQVSERDDATWHLQVSKVMYATRVCIDDFEQDMESVVEPLGGVLDGWGVTQEIHKHDDE
jgi:hypothetical protein